MSIASQKKEPLDLPDRGSHWKYTAQPLCWQREMLDILFTYTQIFNLTETGKASVGKASSHWPIKWNCACRVVKKQFKNPDLDFQKVRIQRESFPFTDIQ